MIEASMVSTVSLLLIVILVHTSQAFVKYNPEVGRIPLLMPNVSPQPGIYLCTTIIPDNTFIVGFEPSMTLPADHMVLYGCSEPGSKKSVWNCGEMAARDEEVSSPCQQGSHSQIIYGWGQDAPKLELPEGVGFKVGKDTTIQYLVVQVHYTDMHHNTTNHHHHHSADHSGVFLHFTKQTLHKQAGVLSLGSSVTMPPPSGVHILKTACSIDEPKVIHPFAFRVHGYPLHKFISAHRIRDGKWTSLGKKDSRKLEMFYPVSNADAIKAGDIVVARCKMVIKPKRITDIGTTSEDEMCNFYMMYYVDHGAPLNKAYCFTGGPPKYY